MKRKFNMRKLILSLSTIGMLALTTTASTYAWFKINAKASVENFNFEVIGGKGFMVSIDGGTYYNSLTRNQLEKAMIVQLSSGKYELGYESDDDGNITESDVLYEISYVKGRKVRTKVENSEEIVSKLKSNIKLAPVTSDNGCDFTNLIKVPRYASSGDFVEFDVYFKSTSDRASDNLKYDIYLDGYGGLDNEGNKIVPTEFYSDTTNVELLTFMDAVSYDADDNKQFVRRTDAGYQGHSYKAGDIITVYSTNAARMSTTVNTKTEYEGGYVLTSDVKFGDKYYYLKQADDSYEEVTVTIGDDIPENTYYEYIEPSVTYASDTSTALIYELNDTKDGKKKDLGSYVTDYDQQSDNFDMDTYYNYSYECNAMYSYYNNLRNSSPLKKGDRPYSKLPKTIKSLPTVSSDNISLKYDKIVTVESGGEEQLVTFRLWLEGWDADCFDGLSNAINVKLALGSKRVD